MAFPSIKNGGAAYTTNSGVPTSSLNLTKPTGASAPAVGDLLVVCVGNDDNTSTDQWDSSTNKPTGFTLINSAGGATPDAHVAAFWRIADGTETATLNCPAQSSDDMWGVYMVIEGADPVTPIGNSGQDRVAGNATSVTVTGITADVAEMMAIIPISGDGGDTDPFSWSSGWNEITEVYAGTSSTNCSGAVAYRDVTAAGTAPDATITLNASDGKSAFYFLVQPPLGPTPTSIGTDNEVDDDETSVTIVGSQFEAVQGTGKVEFSDNATYGSGTVVEQTAIGSWADGAIEITVEIGTLTPGTPRYLWVTNDSGERNATGFEFHLHRAQAWKMSLSSNFAPGSTTAQLTAPAGKTSGTDFDGGRIEEAANPSATTTNVGNSNYREDEWCLQASAAAREQTYVFRALYGDTLANTYAVTPRATVAPAAASYEYEATPGALTLTGLNATFDFTDHITYEGVVGALQLAGQVADAVLSDNYAYESQVGALVLTGQTADWAFTDHVSYESVTGAITLTGLAGDYVRTTNLDLTVDVQGALTLSGLTADVVFTSNLEASLDAPGALVLTGVVQLVDIGTAGSWDALPGALTLTGQVADTDIDTSRDFDATPGHLTLAGLQPDLIVGLAFEAVPGQLTWAGLAADVEVSTDLDLTLDTPGVLTLTGLAPDFDTGFRYEPAPGHLKWTGLVGDLVVSDHKQYESLPGLLKLLGVEADVSYPGSEPTVTPEGGKSAVIQPARRERVYPRRIRLGDEWVLVRNWAEELALVQAYQDKLERQREKEVKPSKPLQRRIRYTANRLQTLTEARAVERKARIDRQNKIILEAFNDPWL